jgi:formylglycine-generating enzyme required for sulfatase activity
VTMRIMALFVLIGLSATLPTRGQDVGDTWQNARDGMVFVWIPAGVLELEVETNGALDDPITFVQGFWMGRTEVTVGQFRRFVEATGYVTNAEQVGNRFTWRDPDFPQTDEHPVVYVSAEDARRYTAWAGVDLPTETEWLHAAGAAKLSRFHWGDTMDDDYAWHRGNAGDGSRPVATKRPNPWGLHDMVGNVFEWVVICEGVHAPRGGSWTRCPRYRHLHGSIVEPFNNDMARRLSPCPPVLPTYPWDDDRGFRCIRREGYGGAPLKHD